MVMKLMQWAKQPGVAIRWEIKLRPKQLLGNLGKLAPLWFLKE